MATASTAQRGSPWGVAEVVPMLGVSGLPTGSILRLAAAGYRLSDEASSSSAFAPELHAPVHWPSAPVASQAAARPSVENNKTTSPTPDKVNTLQVHLTQLQKEDQSHVFIVRGISRMGFKSQEILEAYCAKFGNVLRVMVAHSKVKPFRGDGKGARIRPGSLGFVVMDSAESVSRVLAAGEEQTVAGCRIRFERFQQMTKPSGSGSDEPTAIVGSASEPLDPTRRRRARIIDERDKSSAASSASDQVSASVESSAWAMPLAPASAPVHMQAPMSIDGGSHHQETDWTAAAAAVAEGAQPCTLGAQGRLAPTGVAGDGDGARPPDVSQILELVNSLARLQSLLNEPGRLSALSGHQCAEAVSLSRIVQQQLQSLLDRCHRLLAPGGAPGLSQAQPWTPQPSPAPLPALDQASLEIAHLLRMLGPTQPAPPPAPPPLPAPNSTTMRAATAAAAVADAAVLQLRLAREQLQRIQLVDSLTTGATQWPFAQVGAWGLASASAWPDALLGASSLPSAAASGLQQPQDSNMEVLRLQLAAAALAAAVGTPSTATNSCSAMEMPDTQLASPPSAPPQEQDVLSPGGSGLAPLPERMNQKKTLGMHLTELQREDPKRVFIVRRISSMGFQSQETLASHYSQYGKVIRVLVAHSKVKPLRNAGAQPRIRPGSLGFIVMDSAKAVKCILAVGKEQIVGGSRICVEPFEQTAKPREGGHSVAASTADSVSTATGDTPGSGSGSGSGGSRSGSNGSGSTGSEKGSGSTGSDKGSDEGSRQKERVREKVKGGSTDSHDSQLEQSSESGSGTEAVSPSAKEAGK
mmetsp:Transcript_123279/g.310297  ORF Transcript_123279/g.310297 Transcript_123279/m.310297 type:complete len:811 (+) Transcript_123279:41-2473(+)